MPTPDLVDRAAIDAAVGRIGDDLRHTPMWRTASLSGLLGRPVLLKAENLQRTGSFKPRGALNVLRSMPSDGREVVAGSAGNHAQGVALAAAMTDHPVVVYMPRTASLPKMRATQDYGAAVRQVGDTVDDAIAAATDHAAETGARFISPFDDPLVVAGQGTLGLEIADQAAPLVDGPVTVLVPVGGGGLISGIGAALAETPGWSVIGVEAESAASMTASLAAGRPTTLPDMSTMADGIALKSPCALTLAHVEAHADEIITVCEEDIAAALLLILERARTVVEPAGAVGLAGLLAGAVPGDGPVVCVLSGGNVDPMLLATLIEHGLTAAGRFLRLRVIAPDRPGALARLTALLAEMGLNVTAVEHHREGATVGLAEVEILITVETRDRAHGDEVLQALDAAGIRAEVLN